MSFKNIFCNALYQSISITSISNINCFMAYIQPYEINHIDFSSRFKFIRKEKDTHFGQYHLMKDKQSKKRVIVKQQPFDSQEELQYILQGISSLLILNQCPSIVRFIGYSVKAKVISLIYQNHQNTFDESLKGIGSKAISDKAILTFLFNMIEALAFLESLNINHLNIKLSNILEQNKESLNNCYKLFYTNYTTDSVTQIRNLHTPIESYFLSSLQLDSLNSQQISLSFEDKIHSDIQSLGLICLWLSTPSVKDKYYQYNQDDELEINQESIARRMKQFRKNYSKKAIKILQILLGGQEDTFSDILNVITNENNLKSKKHVSITEENEQKERSSREQSMQKFQQFQKPPRKSITQPQRHHSSKNQESSFVQHSARRKYYLQSLNEIEQRIIYRSGTKELLPNMEEKQYTDGSYYIGQLSSTKQRQGKGIYYYSEGDIYAGDWRDNTLQGYGIYLFSNGEKYEGGVEKGVKVGKGQYVYCNNNKYEGEWQNDKKHGYGIYIYQSKGEKYEGQFKAGSKDGRGIFYYSNGDKYEGQFYHGDKHGNGIARYHNSHKVTGTWELGELNGSGFVEYKNGDKSTSKFIKGVKEGHGNYMYENQTQFQGQYENNLKTGNSIIKYSNGDIYKGNLLNGKRQGLGIYSYSNGTVYEGQWKQNNRHGKGEFKLSNGTIVSGIWDKSNLLNPCIIMYLNGETYEGNTTKLIIKEGQGNYSFSGGQTLQGEFKNDHFVKGVYSDELGNQTQI